MCKKSLRTAIYLHERLTEGGYGDGNYGGLTGDDRKEIFNKRLLELEPKLKSCPFCKEKVTYQIAITSGGLSAGTSGSSEAIRCEGCDLDFKGSYLGSTIDEWNNIGNQP